MGRSFVRFRTTKELHMDPNIKVLVTFEDLRTLTEAEIDAALNALPLDPEPQKVG